MSYKWPNKDSNEILDYSLDWSRWLRSGETIVTSSWTIVDAEGVKVAFVAPNTVDGLTNSGVTNSGTITTLTLSAGTPNKQYKLYCSVALNTGLVAERSVTISIKER